MGSIFCNCVRHSSLKFATSYKPKRKKYGEHTKKLNEQFLWTSNFSVINIIDIFSTRNSNITKKRRCNIYNWLKINSISSTFFPLRYQKFPTKLWKLLMSTTLGMSIFTAQLIYLNFSPFPRPITTYKCLKTHVTRPHLTNNFTTLTKLLRTCTNILVNWVRKK